jgi:hypothetical protein
MKNLADLQQQFLADCLATKNATLDYIKPDDLSPKQRMSIYQNSTLGNTAGSLAITYPVVKNLVGEDFFNAMCAVFIRQNPPQSTNMDDYGEEFSEFLAEFPPAQSLLYLPDVATLEWLWQQASNAAECQIIDQSAIANIPQDKYFSLHLRLHSSAQLFCSTFPVSKIWYMNQDGAHVETINLDEETTEYLLIIRHGLRTNISPLTPAEHCFLNNLKNGSNFFAAYEESIAIDESFDLAHYIQKHLAGGTFSGFTVG